MNELKVSDAKVRIKKIFKIYGEQIYLSFSGGKDSTVLAHLIIECINETSGIYIPFVFSNTGLELPETIRFVKEFSYDNVQIIFPKMRPIEVFERYGKPAISKEWDDRVSTYQNKLSQGFTKDEAVDPNISLRAAVVFVWYQLIPRK